MFVERVRPSEIRITDNSNVVNRLRNRISIIKGKL